MGGGMAVLLLCLGALVREITSSIMACSLKKNPYFISYSFHFPNPSKEGSILSICHLVPQTEHLVRRQANEDKPKGFSIGK
jgi:hypothetical protein